MKKKLTGYSLVSFFSFCFFTILFHSLAGAQALPHPLSPSLLPSPSPTPASSPTSLPTPSLTPQPSPTPSPIPPTATPTLTPTIAVVSDLESLFTRYSEEYHADKELLKRIARCESSFNSQAVNGPYAGMFQFVDQTWIHVREVMGRDTNPDLRKSTEESIRTAAYMLGNGQASAWAGCE